MANTAVYAEEWATKLQERLDKPTNWSEVLDVEYTNTQVLNNPYLSTTPSLQSGTRGTTYSFSDFGETNETRTVNAQDIIPIFIDRADLAQSTFSKQMYWADLQGQLINERVETLFLAQHGSWTEFGVGDITGGTVGDTTKITVSATNVDDIARHLKRLIYAANGINKAIQNGIAIVWRAADWELLESYAQANGFNLADIAIKDGILPGYRLFGIDHLLSNSHAANHVFGGVKKVGSLGILRDTFGQVVITQDPNLQSGIGVISRLDYGFAWWNNFDSLYYDVNVN
jgi:hypothetical protein